MKRTLIVSTTAAAILLGGSGVAAASPPYVSQDDAMLQQEVADDSYTPPAWMLDLGPTRPAYSYADVILGVTLVVGLVVLW